MHQITPMPHSQILPFLFRPEDERTPEETAAFHEARREADRRQEQSAVEAARDTNR